MPRVLKRRLAVILATTAAVMASGCAKATQSEVLPANGPIAPEQVHKASASENVIYSFRGGSGSTADGVKPLAGLINVSGRLYGTTFLGGAYGLRQDPRGFGTVFSVTPDGAETVLHRFTGSGDGKYPYAGLIDVEGTLYGTTRGGGKGQGTVFSISRSGSEKVLFSFKGARGSTPYAELLNVSGTLYGTTSGGGKHHEGTVFSITPSGAETVVHSFGGTGDGSAPLAGLISVNGKLYGTTLYQHIQGGEGTVFAITPSGKEAVLHSFKGGTSDGAEPEATLLSDGGNLYGTTFDGGEYGRGTVFSITPSGTETLIHSFGDSGDGASPQTDLINVSGTLYGTTSLGGANGCGTVFSIRPSGAESVIYSFKCGTSDGSEPQADLINVNGTLYGTTSGGGAYGRGTVYGITNF